MISDGSYTGDKFPTAEKRQLKDMGVLIYSMSTGYWSNSQFGNVLSLATEGDYYGSEEEWINVIYNTKPSIGTVNHLFRLTSSFITMMYLFGLKDIPPPSYISPLPRTNPPGQFPLDISPLPIQGQSPPPIPKMLLMVWGVWEACPPHGG